MSEEEATKSLLRCCGSSSWARRVLSRRPFRSVEQLHQLASDNWWDLDASDWLEAFEAHPEIGSDQTTSHIVGDARWSQGEQSDVLQAAADVRLRLARANRAYKARFGFIFIICATGKTTEEMLHSLTTRLENVPSEEIRVAAYEQMRIMDLRLDKLLEELASNG